jgi:hypothetical protein
MMGIGQAISLGSQIWLSLDLPPSQTTARPSAELTQYQAAGRDLGLAESGFALPTRHFRIPQSAFT